MGAICVLEATRAGAQNPAMISPRSEQGFPANPARLSLRTLRHPRTIFRRALERGNLVVTEATAKELPPLI